MVNRFELQKKHFEAFQKLVWKRKTIHNQWVPADELFRLMPKERGIDYTPKLFSRALLDATQFNKFSFDDKPPRGGTIHVQHRQKYVYTHGGEKGQTKHFYFVSRTEQRFDAEEDTKVFQQMWEFHESTQYWISNNEKKNREKLDKAIQKGPRQATETNETISDSDPSPSGHPPKESYHQRVQTSPTLTPPTMVAPPPPYIQQHGLPHVTPLPPPLPPYTYAIPYKYGMQQNLPPWAAPPPPYMEENIPTLAVPPPSYAYMQQNTRPGSQKPSAYVEIPKSEYAKLKNAQALANALKQTLTGSKTIIKKRKRVKCTPPPEVKRMYGELAAQMPQVSRGKLSTAIAHAICGFGQSVMAHAAHNGYHQTEPLFTMDQCVACSPSDSSLGNWKAESIRDA